MRLSLASVLALALALAGLSCDRSPASASGPSAGGGVARSGGSSPAGWATYHGGFSLDGVADTVLPDAPERLWRVKVEGRVDSTPVSADHRIYFTSSKGGLFCLDFAGKELWKSSIAPDQFTSSPLVADGLLILGTGKGVLRAFDTAGGKEKWTYDVGGSIQGSPNRVDLPGGKGGVVAISQGDGCLHGIDLATGKGLWKMPAVERCDGSAGASGDYVVMGSCASALHVYSASKGVKVTDISLGPDNQVAGGVAMSGTHAFAGTRSGKLCAVDVADGKILWTFAEGQGEAFATPAVTDRVVVYGADDGKAYAVDRAKGTKVWALDTGNRPMSPVIARDRVVISSGGSLFLADLAGGKKLWSAPVSDDITSPAVVGGMILVGADDGTVTAYGKK
ncbi:MAG TPA: PQQ-binding-like beta-propeller repeat protein [Planctomycetota bacterium]|nr:PQQ-binding-like beta-propeller repeat protein [Planctomycetota bacterium]